MGEFVGGIEVGPGEAVTAVCGVGGGFENGVHIIQWTASDSGSDTDGIGSRYFSIQNSRNRSALSVMPLLGIDNGPQGMVDLSQLPLDESPVSLNLGFNRKGQGAMVHKNEQGVFRWRLP